MKQTQRKRERKGGKTNEGKREKEKSGGIENRAKRAKQKAKTRRGEGTVHGPNRCK